MKKILLNLLFPKSCLGCNREGSYLCPDCLALIDISDRFFLGNEYLSRLYFATDYENFIVKKLVGNFKYKPFAKDLAKTLSSLIIIYLENLENKPQFFENKQDFILVPIPLFKKRLKWRGFNQAEEIAKHLSEFLSLTLNANVLSRVKNTVPQLNLPQDQRKENVKNAFVCKNSEIIKNKIVLLIDDVHTTGNTMNEAAKVLKQSGAHSVWAIVVAKG